MPKQELTPADYEAMLTARAHQMMETAHNIIRNKNATLPPDKRQKLPGWSFYVDQAAKELDATIEEEEPTPAPAPIKGKKGKTPVLPTPEASAPAAEPTPALAAEPTPALTPEPAPAN